MSIICRRRCRNSQQLSKEEAARRGVCAQCGGAGEYLARTPPEVGGHTHLTCSDCDGSGRP